MKHEASAVCVPGDEVGGQLFSCSPHDFAQATSSLDREEVASGQPFFAKCVELRSAKCCSVVVAPASAGSDLHDADLESRGGPS